MNNEVLPLIVGIIIFLLFSWVLIFLAQAGA